jgi:dipeptidyl-peptidase-4
VTESLSFPRAHARSRRFTLGRPRSFTVAPDGSRVLFLRSDAGDDPVHHLWSLDPATGRDARVVDAGALGVDEDDLPAAERARRERARESAGGIVAYATDRDVTVAAFAVGGAPWRVDLSSGEATPLRVEGAAYDVRPSPGGGRVAAVVDGVLHVSDGDVLRPLVGEAGVAWGVADFVAAEEMRRLRGFWWSPDGTELLACRVDESAVTTLTIADPANPERPAVGHRYPLAGTANPEATLWRVDATTGDRAEVAWDRDAFPYLAVVRWGADGPPLLQVESRDQRTAQTLAVEGTTSRLVRTDTDDDWIDLVPGAPAWAGDRLASVVDLADHGPGGSRALVVGERVVTPPGMQVRALVHVDGETAWLTASTPDPTQVHVVRVALADGTVDVVTEAAGLHGVVVGGDVQVRSHASLDAAPTATVHGPAGDHAVPGRSLDPGLAPRVELLELGDRRLRGALLRPEGDGPWPVLLDPYGGPHAQRVLQSRDAFLTPAWFARQGFAVLVVDGRGSPGRGPAWERAVRDDLATPPLEDQVDALRAAAELEPRLDLDRVAMRGWSFGGYLAALACLRRPDVFRAGVVGAPVTDWRLYDTHYTERYLGHPDAQPEVYRASSLVDEDAALVDPAPPPEDRPLPELLVIHGLADDNVVAAHSLRLSSALLAAGRPHAFLPLSGVTHMTPQEVVAENLLLLQRDFLRRVLG